MRATRHGAITAAAAAAMVRPGRGGHTGQAFASRDEFDIALAARRDELHDVKIRRLPVDRPVRCSRKTPGSALRWAEPALFGLYRRKHDAGRIGYMPVRPGRNPRLLPPFHPARRIVVIRTCRIDKDGFFNFSAANLWHRAILDGRCVIVEVTDGLPYCLGVENGVHVSEVDFIIEGDNRPPPCCRTRPRPRWTARWGG